MAASKERLHVVLRGAVQGSGFRPAIYRMAQRLRLAGWVRYTDAAIELEVQGGSEQLATFLHLLNIEKPGAAVVASEEVVRIPLQQSAWFEILPSEPRQAAPTPPSVVAR